LEQYSQNLAIGVTEAMHHFIGRGRGAPQDDSRYLAVTAAHVTHMLRDTEEDIQAGYFNIPREYLDLHRITPEDIHSDPYQAWVAGRIRWAREAFAAGARYLQRVECLRCRLAGLLYVRRFRRTLGELEATQGGVLEWVS
jgi:phytoene/squalene synthetase